MSDVFASVSSHRYPPIYNGDELNYLELMGLCRISRAQVAAMNGIKADSVRFDSRMPRHVREFFYLLATIVDHLAEYFKDHAPKITAWLHTPNPLLGDIKPMQMILLGRIEKLLKFIIDAKEGNLP